MGFGEAVGQGGENVGDLASLAPYLFFNLLNKAAQSPQVQGTRRLLKDAPGPEESGDLGRGFLLRALGGFQDLGQGVEDVGSAVGQRFFGPPTSGLGVPSNRQTPVQDASDVLFQGGRNEREGRIKDLMRDEKVQSDLQGLMEKIQARRDKGVNKATPRRVGPRGR